MRATHSVVHQGAPGSSSSPCRDARAWRFFPLNWLWLSCWQKVIWLEPHWTNHSFVISCEETLCGIPPECILQPTCSAPHLLQHCWWGTTHSWLSKCLWWNERIYDLPYSPSTSTVSPPTSAFRELEGQKFKSCFEQLLTCYQLLHIASTGRILTISLEMSLLK